MNSKYPFSTRGPGAKITFANPPRKLPKAPGESGPMKPLLAYNGTLAEVMRRTRTKKTK